MHLRFVVRIPSDLMIVLVWTVLTLVFTLAPVLKDTSVRTLLGIPMVLFIPGYVLISALFPGRNELEGIERTALSMGLSIAVVPLLGLLLNFSFGIRLVPILITLCIYTVILLFTASYRREKLPEDKRFAVSFRRIYYDFISGIRAKDRTDRILTGILIFSIVLAISMIYYVITTPKIGERFTEFYILNTSGKAEDYPTDLKLNSPAQILVGVVNHEYTTVNYTLRVILDNEVLTDSMFRLEHNETWEHNVSFVPDKKGSDMKLRFWLFREDNFTAPYRKLHLWVNVRE